MRALPPPGGQSFITWLKVCSSSLSLSLAHPFPHCRAAPSGTAAMTHGSRSWTRPRWLRVRPTCSSTCGGEVETSSATTLASF